MPGFLSGVEEGMGKKKKDDGGKDDDKKPALAKTLGKAIAGKMKKKSSGGGDSGPNYSTESTGWGSPPSAKKGGTIRKSGLVKLHKGEKVLTKKQAKKYSGGKRSRR